jgi:hypothetical protein
LFSSFATWKGESINFSMTLFWIIHHDLLNLTEFNSNQNGRSCVR